MQSISWIETFTSNIIDLCGGKAQLFDEWVNMATSGKPSTKFPLGELEEQEPPPAIMFLIVLKILIFFEKSLHLQLFENVCDGKNSEIQNYFQALIPFLLTSIVIPTTSVDTYFFEPTSPPLSSRHHVRFFGKIKIFKNSEHHENPEI